MPYPAPYRCRIPTTCHEIVALMKEDEFHVGPAANLYDADLEGANLTDANLKHANLQDAIGLDGANLEDAIGLEDD